MNISLLENPHYVSTIRNIINNVISTYIDSDDAHLWEIMKFSIRSYTISFSKKLARFRKNYELSLLNEIAFLENVYVNNPNDYNLNNLQRARDSLNLVYDHKFKGIVLRSRARWSEYGERNTKYFLNLERRNKSNSTISEIISDNGCTLTNCYEIINEAYYFYKKLYTKDPHINVDNFFDKLNIDHTLLSDIQRNSIEGFLTLEECTDSIFSMSNNKSPGSDGIPVEFYKKNWNDIGSLVLNSLNHAFSHTSLSDEQGRANISLFPKPCKDPKLLKNWRPIALLNTDYKIGAKCIASRIKTVLNYVVSTEQSGFIKGRYIGENVRVILDLIEFCNVYSINGALIFLDYEKAFDSLDWKFIFQTLSFFNFGPNVISWIKTFYTNVTSCVVNNGHSSRYFQVSRGVRQGCPLSPYLFILCSELFASIIKSNNRIKGIKIYTNIFKILQYADDTVLICDGSNESFNEINKAIQLFSSGSGLRVNSDKCFVFPLGYSKNQVPHYFVNSGFTITFGPVRYLGITFTNHAVDFFRLNYLPKLSRLKNILNIWSSRDLTPLGKITLIKSFAISQFVYLFTVLPNPPQSFIKDLNTILYNFIWNSKPDKVKRTVLIQDKNVMVGFV